MSSTPTSLNRLTIKQLKEKLAEQGLDVTGKKVDLIARLQKNDEADKEEAVKDADVKDDDAAQEETAEAEDAAEEEMEDAENGDGEENVEDGGNEEADAEEEEAVEEENEEEEEVVGDEEPQEEEEENAEDAEEQEELSQNEEDELLAEDENAEEVVNAEDEGENEEENEEADDNEEAEEKEDEQKEEDEEMEGDENVSADDFITLSEEKGDGDEAETADGTKESPAKGKQAGKEKLPIVPKNKRWLQYTTGRLVEKYRHLNSVSDLSLKTKTREFDHYHSGLRVKVFPITIDDLSSAVITEYMKKCIASNVHFEYALDDEDNKKIVGTLSLTFKYKHEVEDCIKTLGFYRDDIRVHTRSMEDTSRKFQDDCYLTRTKSRENVDETTILVPELPDSLSIEELWALFPLAWDIVYVPPEGPSQANNHRRQLGYAYIYFPNKEIAKRATIELGRQKPTDDMRVITLMPVNATLRYFRGARKPLPAGAKPSKQDHLASKKPQAPPQKKAPPKSPKAVTSIFSADPVPVKSGTQGKKPTGPSKGPGGQNKKFDKNAPQSRTNKVRPLLKTPVQRSDKQQQRTQVYQQRRSATNYSGGPSSRGARPHQGTRAPNQSPRLGQGTRGGYQGTRGSTRGSSRGARGGYQGTRGRPNQGPRGMQSGFHQQQQQQQQQQQMGGQKEQGLQVLDDLLSTLGRLPRDQTNPGATLAQMIQQPGGSQGYRGREDDYYGGRHNQHSRSPKRAHSPDTRGDYAKRRRSDGPVNYGGGGAGYSGGYGNRYDQDTSAYQSQGYSRQNIAATAASSGDTSGFDHLDVVSRIVRASKELKKAMGRDEMGHEQGQGQRQGGGFGYGNSASSYNQSRY